MPEDKTPAEEVRKANDEYHKAIDAIMLSEDFDIAVKARIGGIAKRIFNHMTAISDLLQPPAEEPPEEE